MKSVLISICKSLLHVFFLFPIKKNRVVFSAYSGRSYSCNPKYITEALFKECPEGLEVYWAFTDVSAHGPLDERIRTVKFKSLRYLYVILTAAVVVDNVESWSILPKRKGQFVMNTWHGGGAYKGVGLMRRDTDAAADRNMLKKNERVDLYLSSSRAFTQMTLRDSFGYTGEVLECGMPRNDMLLDPDKARAELVRRSLSADGNCRLVLYAPTFRADKDYEYPLDAKALLGAMSARFGGTWKLLYRAHYYLDGSHFSPEDIIDVSSWEDMQELLLVSDALVTDYSSSIWDFSLMRKPGFLYVPDLSSYGAEREFYTPIETWPYPFAEDMDGLCRIIAEYDEKKNIERINKHLEDLGSAESGCASETAAQRIAEKIGRRQ